MSMLNLFEGIPCFSKRLFSLDFIDICLMALPLLAAFLLVALVASTQPGVLDGNQFSGGQFIVMPRSCYLIIP